LVYKFYQKWCLYPGDAHKIETGEKMIIYHVRSCPSFSGVSFFIRECELKGFFFGEDIFVMNGSL